eukprot:SAG11_NODE_136_length_15118_cov_14.188495_6_plen_167_part_00
MPSSQVVIELWPHTAGEFPAAAAPVWNHTPPIAALGGPATFSAQIGLAPGAYVVVARDPDCDASGCGWGTLARLSIIEQSEGQRGSEAEGCLFRQSIGISPPIGEQVCPAVPCLLWHHVCHASPLNTLHPPVHGSAIWPLRRAARWPYALHYTQGGGGGGGEQRSG